MLPIPIDIDAAIRAGAVAGTIVVALSIVARMLGTGSANPLLILGRILTGREEAGTEMVGFLAHLILSILMAMAYAVVFSLWPPAYWWRGLVLSVPHLVLTGIVIVSCALRRPEYRRYMWSPEQFKGTAHPGYDLLVLIVLHLIYGTTVGMLYTA